MCIYIFREAISINIKCNNASKESDSSFGSQQIFVFVQGKKFEFLCRKVGAMVLRIDGNSGMGSLVSSNL